MNSVNLVITSRIALSSTPSSKVSAINSRSSSPSSPCSSHTPPSRRSARSSSKKRRTRLARRNGRRRCFMLPRPLLQLPRLGCRGNRPPLQLLLWLPRPQHHHQAGARAPTTRARIPSTGLLHLVLPDLHQPRHPPLPRHQLRRHGLLSMILGLASSRLGRCHGRPPRRMVPLLRTRARGAPVFVQPPALRDSLDPGRRRTSTPPLLLRLPARQDHRRPTTPCRPSTATCRPQSHTTHPLSPTSTCKLLAPLLLPNSRLGTKPPSSTP